MILTGALLFGQQPLAARHGIAQRGGYCAGQFLRRRCNGGIEMADQLL
jgi:hypothetical protein